MCHITWDQAPYAELDVCPHTNPALSRITLEYAAVFVGRHFTDLCINAYSHMALHFA
jgi:hypothetical protein